MNRKQILRYTVYFMATAVVGGIIVFSQLVNLRQLEWRQDVPVE